MNASTLSVALIHHPVYDKQRKVVATAVTNLDIHDIARAARTYGLYRYYVVTPLQDQRTLALRIAGHWKEGYGATYNPKRKEALELVEVIDSLDAARQALSAETGAEVKLVATGARLTPDTAYEDLAAMLAVPGTAYLLLLGTGWGLTEELLEQADHLLPPLRGAGEYNHLSVRSAAAIIFDRLRGDK
ncbi:MAG TPA: RNA methyltransferase [Verrucomicrobiae bacterium]|nr:RNA methyltransferase [Verrucomicrobiae bacterium]